MNNHPKHIAVIIDGNGRWALNRALPRIMGHQKGVEAARNLVKMCIDYQVEILSLYVFSSENWRRPKDEVSMLMNLCLKLLTEEIISLHENNIKLQIIGDIVPLPLSLKEAIHNAKMLTEKNDGLKLNIAINYGGRWDIVNAMRQIANDVLNSKLKPEELNETLFSSYLSLQDLPDPDLMIRTSGECRISNFFLWQSAYTELFFTDVLWPDFSIKDFQQALNFFRSRTRKFGGLVTNANV
jgi:undecaprenyl diphosphate synthase